MKPIRRKSILTALISVAMVIAFTGCGEENAESSVESTVSSTPTQTSSTVEQPSEVTSVVSETSVEESSVVESSEEEMSRVESSEIVDDTSTVESKAESSQTSKSKYPISRKVTEDEVIAYGKITQKVVSYVLYQNREFRQTFWKDDNVYIIEIDNETNSVGILADNIVFYIDSSNIELYPDDYITDENEYWVF